MSTIATTSAPQAPARLPTGNSGLDEILEGGFVAGHLYLLAGLPGTGKTTVAMQFLMANAAVGMRGVYITLSETADELRMSAQSHGWVIPPLLTLFELLPPENLLNEERQQSLLYSSDLELGESVRRVFEEVEQTQPSIVVLDSLSEIRLLAQSSLRYRRQVLSLKHYFIQRGVTVLMLDDLTSEVTDKTVHSVAHGVVMLEELAPAYGAERRRMRVLKYRGSSYRGGYHDFTIARGGVTVFPRLRAVDHKRRVRAHTAGQWHRRTRPVARRRRRARHERPAAGPGRRRQIAARGHVCARGRCGATRRPRCSSSTKSSGCSSIVRARHGHRPRGHARRRRLLLIEQVDAAELSPGEFSERVRSTVTAPWRQDRRDRQPQRLPGRHAGGAVPAPARARTAAIPEPPGRDDLPDGRAARSRRRHEGAGRRHLPRRHRAAAALLRGPRTGAPGDLGDQEARRPRTRTRFANTRSARPGCGSANRWWSSRACCAACPNMPAMARR